MYVTSTAVDGNSLHAMCQLFVICRDPLWSMFSNVWQEFTIGKQKSCVILSAICDPRWFLWEAK